MLKYRYATIHYPCPNLQIQMCSVMTGPIFQEEKGERGGVPTCSKNGEGGGYRILGKKVHA